MPRRLCPHLQQVAGCQARSALLSVLLRACSGPSFDLIPSIRATGLGGNRHSDSSKADSHTRASHDTNSQKQHRVCSMCSVSTFSASATLDDEMLRKIVPPASLLPRPLGLPRATRTFLSRPCGESSLRGTSRLCPAKVVDSGRLELVTRLLASS